MNKQLIKEKLVYIKELLVKLNIRIEKYEKATNEEEKETLFAAMSKFVEEIVEIAIKINTLILEDKKDFAASYFESFSRLGKHFKIDESDLKKLAKTAGFRNRIGHEYKNLNTAITLRSFKNLIPVYEKYIDFVLKISKK